MRLLTATKQCLGVVLLSVVALGVQAETATAVEYYYAAWDQYFVTAFPEEIALLDGGAFGGVWQRTGQTFPVATQAVPPFVDTCRFFSVNFAPKSAHFYTPFASECAQVKANPDWQFESVSFYLALSDASGACPPGTAALYRLYNNGAGGAPNHRYTTQRATFAHMVALGWIAEGNGPTAVFACVPSLDSASDATGIYLGVSSAGENIRAIVLPDGNFYIVESVPGLPTERGVINGTATTIGGAFNSSDGNDYPIPLVPVSGRLVQPISLQGTYMRGAALQLDLGATSTAPSRSFTANYVAGSDQSPSLDAVAGQYSGSAGATGGRRNVRFSIDAAGSMTGIADPGGSFETACRFVGTVTPHESIGVFDITLTSLGTGECVFGGRGDSVTGIAYYDPATAEFVAFLPFLGRINIFFLIANK